MHLAWQQNEKELANVKYSMGADVKGELAEGKLLNSEVNFYNVGRNIDERMRKFKANLYVAKKTNEVCPAKWKDEGDKTLVNPGATMVGKVPRGAAGLTTARRDERP